MLNLRQGVCVCVLCVCVCVLVSVQVCKTSVCMPKPVLKTLLFFLNPYRLLESLSRLPFFSKVTNFNCFSTHNVSLMIS